MAGNSTVRVAFVGDSAPLVRATTVATGALDRMQVKARELEATTHRSFLSSGTFALGLAAVGVASLKAAGNFQTLTTQLTTGAGESQKNLAMVSAGMLKMAGDVGISADNLARGMYLVESAGFHGAAGLKVLETAAEGAKTGQADMTVVANALTSALNAYHLPASKAVGVTNLLVAAEKDGKLHMEDLAAALSGILPVAAAAGVSMSEVTGAIATMSMKGTDATVAATYLRQTIGQLENPTKKARNEMAALGLSATDIAQNLGKRGLTGTLEILSEAVARKMGPSGVVMLESLKKASGESGKFQKALNELPPAAQTYVGALATMVGGTKSMQAALQLTGPSMGTFRKNVADGTRALGDNGKHVEGWALIQQTFNQKLQEGTQRLASMGIVIGTKLMGPALKMLDTFSKTVDFFQRNWAVVKPLGESIGALALAVWAANKAAAAFKATMVVLNIEMDANPVGAIVLALEALAIGFAVAWHKSETFRSVVTTAFQVVAEGILGAIQGILDVLGTFATVSDAIFGTHWSGSINKAITKVKDLESSIAGLSVPTVVPISIQITTSRAPLDPRLHAKGFIGPTIAEGKHAQGLSGPFSPLETGAAQVAAQQAAAVAAAVAKRAADLADALNAGASDQAISDAAQKRADAIKAAGEKQAQAIQTASDAIGQALADRKAMSNSLRDTLESSNSIVESGASWTAAALETRFKAKMDKVRRFAAALSKMVHLGYDRTIIAQVANAGVDGGLSTALALASAPPAMRRQINATQASINTAAGVAGDRLTSSQLGAINVSLYLDGNKISGALRAKVNQENRQLANSGHLVLALS